MKIRHDFISNSSSSSYIVALDFKKYPFDLFVKAVCEKCNEGYRNKGAFDSTRYVNEAALRSGMLMECLYLGRPVVGKVREIWRRGEQYDHRMIKRGESDEYTPFNELLARKNSMAPDESVTQIDENTIVYEYDDELPSWRAVPRHTMVRSIRNPAVYAGSSGKSPKARVKRIIEYVKCKATEKIPSDEPEIFLITKNTVNNTRDFMKVGYKVKFKTELAASDEYLSSFLNGIEARMKAGETFIFAVAGDCGEGMYDTRLFMSGGYSNPFENTPAVDVKQEFLGPW